MKNILFLLVLLGTVVGFDESECLQLLSSSAISNLHNGAPCS